MLLRPEALPARLEKGLAPVVTIHGDEPLLALEAADAVRGAARRHGVDERQVFIAQRGFDWSELKNAGAAMSLFGNRKLIDLRVPTGKPGTEGGAALAAYCENPNPDNVLLVTMPRLDRQAQGSSWYSALAAAGDVVEVYPVDRARLPDWIGQRLAKNGQRAAREVLEFLADRVEGNLLAAHQEVQKLALLAPRGELSLEAIEEAVANVARFDTTAASLALLSGDLARYARVLDGLRGEGEATTFVLWVLSGDVQALLRVHEGMDAGRPMEQLLRENRVWRPRDAAFKGALRSIPRDRLRPALARCARIDRMIKGLEQGEPWDAFLQLGLELLDATRH